MFARILRRKVRNVQNMCSFKKIGYRIFIPVIAFYIAVSTVLLIKFNSTVINYTSGKQNITVPIYRHWHIPDLCPESTHEKKADKNDVCSWFQHRESAGNIVIFGNQFAQLKNVILDPSKAVGRKGGEKMDQLWNQDENSEYFKLQPSYFTLQCKKFTDWSFIGKNHLNDWIKSVKCLSGYVNETRDIIPETTIAIQRYEYANLYHTMTDCYNAFLIMIFIKTFPQNINILLIDGHPLGSLDSMWSTLFRMVKRAGTLKKKTTFLNLIWGIMGYNSPLNNHGLRTVPYLESFREFFLKQHSVSFTQNLNCKKLTVLFIWRRDYVAHPRNPSGRVSRKIQNEDELFEHVSKLIPKHEVKAVQLDRLNMSEQLEIISKTDILIGMHGAGLTHTLFLPKHSGLIEFYPTYWSETNRHFRMMAAWRNLHYLVWKNHDISNEFPNKLTYIPPKTVKTMVKEMISKICPNEVL